MGQIEKRTEERTRALVRARLRDSGLERDACILDLSAQGLLVTAAMPPRCHQTVTIVANGYRVSGQVRWVNERRFGVSLDAPILVEDVIDAKILAPKQREEHPGLPEGFGARPAPASAGVTLADYIPSKMHRYALIVVAGVVAALILGWGVGTMFGDFALQADAERAAIRAVAMGSPR